MAPPKDEITLQVDGREVVVTHPGKRLIPEAGVSKLDLVDAVRREAVMALIKALNPMAEVVAAEHGRVPLDRILDTGRFDLERAASFAGCE